jgi:hypothetical protein
MNSQLKGNGITYHAKDRSGDPCERPQRAQVPHAPAATDKPEQERRVPVAGWWTD